ncbi:hypothetical protein Q6346_00940 [Isoptericola sp. b490]|nr:hypothetical protein [Isoptericola sp. b490]MDO8119874.1 hypothetical protein [Isoptericola sp. b490]
MSTALATALARLAGLDLEPATALEASAAAPAWDVPARTRRHAHA